MGFSIFAYDYHGYGTSEGKPSERNTYLDIDAAYEYLTDKLVISSRRIILHGRSLGGGPSADLASRKTVAGLVLESTFTTALQVMLPNSYSSNDKFRNIEKISKVKCPVLVIHGKSDEVIPFECGEKLFEAANDPKRFLWVENAGHNNLTQTAGDLYSEMLREFAEWICTIQKNTLK